MPAKREETETGPPPGPRAVRRNGRIVLDGLASAHSHAFQRALRGRTERRATSADSFWSWRRLMYGLVEGLTPADVHAISRFAFVELALSGVTAVGEFHYLHHDRDGRPYADRLEMAEAVIAAAKEAGIRIALLRTAYLRAGHREEPAPAQKRFIDPDVEAALADVDELAKRHRSDPRVAVGIAAHSLRAVPREAVVELAAFARRRGLPFHMHVAEQRLEVDRVLAEHGRRPVHLLAELGVLDERFVAVHAIEVNEEEIGWLGEPPAFVCLCRSTERDLGDGLPRTSKLVEAGVRLCVGVDAHVVADPFEEMRAVELDERARTARRHVAADARELLEVGSRLGYVALGMADRIGEDEVSLRDDDPALAGAPDDRLEDAVVFAGTPRAVDTVVVGGATVVAEGRHPRYEEARRAFEATVARLLG